MRPEALRNGGILDACGSGQALPGRLPIAVPRRSRSRRVDGNSLSRNLASQVVRLVSFGIEDSFDKRAAKGRAARRYANRFDDDNPAEQSSSCRIVIQGDMVHLVSVVSGFLPYAQAEILLRWRTRAGVQNFGPIAVKLGVSEVELDSVRNGWSAGGVALGEKLKTPHSNDRCVPQSLPGSGHESGLAVEPPPGDSADPAAVVRPRWDRRCAIAQALAAGATSIPRTAAPKIAATARFVTFMMLPLSVLVSLYFSKFRETVSPEPPCEKLARKP